MFDKDFLENENGESRQNMALSDETRMQGQGSDTTNSDMAHESASRVELFSEEMEQSSDTKAIQTGELGAKTMNEANMAENTTDGGSALTEGFEENLNNREDARLFSEQPIHADIHREQQSNQMHDEKQENTHIFKEQEPRAEGENARYNNTYTRVRKKKKSVFGRIIGLVASAAAFGLIAGGIMIGMQRYAKELGILPKNATTMVLGKVVDGDTTQETRVSNLVKKENGPIKILDVSEIAHSAMPSIVAINGRAQVVYESWFGGRQTYITPTSGSGIIIGENDEELLIVTNNHVVDETSELSVVFIDDEEVKATVKGGDSDSDLAVIAVKLEDLKEETKGSISIASIGNSDNIKVGEGVVAIGNALGYGQSVTQGIVSAKNRDIETKNGKTKGLIQTDAAINPGNSGGALLNMRGEVIGINSVKYSSTEVEGMGYAIPITTVEDIIKELSTKVSRSLVDEEKQGTVGIQGQDINQQMSETYDIPQGVYVYQIIEGGAAEDSELQEKDIITKLDSDKIKSMEDLKKTLSYYRAGDKVKLTIQRLEGSEYVEMTIDITLGKRSDLKRR